LIDNMLFAQIIEAPQTHQGLFHRAGVKEGIARKVTDTMKEGIAFTPPCIHV
jgi:hypothetical protein